MEHYQKLDKVLKHLSRHRRFVTHHHMMSSKIIPAAEEAEYLSLLQILVDQKLVSTFHEKYDEKGKPLSPALYQINSNGLEFTMIDSFKGLHEKEVVYHHPELRQSAPKPAPSPKPVTAPSASDATPSLTAQPTSSANAPAASAPKPMNMKMVYWIGGIAVVGLILWYILTR